jgi:uncharacterized protein
MNIPRKETRIAVKVQPNAHRSEVAGLTGGVWKIKIAAHPDKGKANQELIDFLSDKLAISKDSITILRGHTSRNKVLLIGALTTEEIDQRLGSQ